MIRKLRTRFVVFNMVIVTVLLVVMMVMVLRFNRQTLREQSFSALQRAATVPRKPVDPGEAMPNDLPVAWFSLSIGPDGQLQAWGSDHFDLTDQEGLMELLEEAREQEQSMGTLEDRNLRYMRSENVVAFVGTSGEELVMANIRRSCLLVGVVSFVAFFLVSLLLSYIAVRPVEKTWEQQRQFVADASHELKTPLSVIMANAELLQSEDCDSGNRARFSGNILSMSYQMRSLVERMLEMARVDSVKIVCKPLDLSQLVSDAVLSVQLLYEEKGRPLISRLQEGLLVQGSENHLYQLMDVLLDNALKYSQGEGPVEVTLKAQGGCCLLTVTSPGTPLSRQQRRDIFKRFYRVDPARSMDGSYGLGLSIAQGIVRGHRGIIFAEAGEDCNSFQVRLPMGKGTRLPLKNTE